MSKDNRITAGLLEDGCYKFSIVKGNNSELVRRVLETRECWSEMPDKYNTTLFSFKWCPISRYCHFEYLSSHGHKNMVNHYERHD